MADTPPPVVSGPDPAGATPPAPGAPPSSDPGAKSSGSTAILRVTAPWHIDSITFPSEEKAKDGEDQPGDVVITKRGTEVPAAAVEGYIERAAKQGVTLAQKED